MEFLLATKRKRAFLDNLANAIQLAAENSLKELEAIIHIQRLERGRVVRRTISNQRYIIHDILRLKCI